MSKMRRGFLVLAVSAGLLGIYVLGRWLDMYEQSGSFNQFTVFLNDLVETQPPSIDWCFFRDWDFPTGKCEKVFLDVPMVWIAVALIALATLAAWASFKNANAVRKSLA
jgi:hypothetical protein